MNLNRNTIGKNLKELVADSMCNPERVLFSLANARGYGGFHLTHVVANGPSLRVRTRNNIKPALHQGIAKLGKGVEGIAFIGCLDTKCDRMVVIKVAKTGLKHEYGILNRIYKLSPHVPVPYLMVRCKDREMLYEEYANGGDVTVFFDRYKNVLTAQHLKVIAFQVLWTLYAIQKAAPTFRHNDLHLGNVLLNFKDGGPKGTRYKTDSDKFEVPNLGFSARLNDFGFAHMAGVPNPKVNNAQCKISHGICGQNDKMYDAHFFLNSLHIEVQRLNKPFTKSLEAFIGRVFGSASYMGNTSNKIKDARLRFGVNHTGLMTLPDILRDPYFAEFRMARPVQPVNIRNVLGPKRKTPSPPKKKTPSPPTKLKTPSPLKKKKTPSPASGGPCGKKARPIGGVGAERLTTKEMLELIKRKGHVVPKDKSRDSLCAVIKLHKLNAPSPVVARPAPAATVMAAPVSVAVAVARPLPAATVMAGVPMDPKAFVKAQGVTVIQPSEAHAWKIKKRKLQEELYDKMNKNNGTTYQNRMNLAETQAAKMIREMRGR
jgi:hypothetical protein